MATQITAEYKANLRWQDVGLDGHKLSTREFHDKLVEIRDRLDHPEAGFFGPGSMIWKVSRERSLLFCGAWAGLLQLAHPAVAQGVLDSGGVDANFSERGINTLRAMYSLVYRDADAAVQMATKVHGMHTRVTGTMPESAGRMKKEQGYEALTPDLMKWVAATLIEGSAIAYRQYIAPLSWEEEQELFADQQVVYGMFFGIPVAAMWPTLADFKAYFYGMLDSPALEVSQAGKEIGWKFMLGPAEYRPAVVMQMSLASHTLPKHLRKQFGIPDGPVMQASYRAHDALLRNTLTRLPDPLRYAPIAYRAEQRLGLRPPHRLDSVIRSVEEQHKKVGELLAKFA